MEQRRVLVEELSRCHAVLLREIVVSIASLRRTEDALDDGREQQRRTVPDHPHRRSEARDGQMQTTFDVRQDIVSEPLVSVERARRIVRVDLRINEQNNSALRERVPHLSTVLQALPVDLQRVRIVFNDVEKSVHELGNVRSLLAALSDRLVGENRLQVERQTAGSSC